MWFWAVSWEIHLHESWQPITWWHVTLIVVIVAIISNNRSNSSGAKVHVHMVR